MSLPEAILIAGISVGIGLGIGIGLMFYFLYRIFCVLAAAMTGDGMTMRRAISGTKTPKPSPDEKTVPPMPELGLEAMADKEAVMDKLRKKQDSSDSHNY